MKIWTIVEGYIGMGEGIRDDRGYFSLMDAENDLRLAAVDLNWEVYRGETLSARDGADYGYLEIRELEVS